MRDGIDAFAGHESKRRRKDRAASGSPRRGRSARGGLGSHWHVCTTEPYACTNHQQQADRWVRPSLVAGVSNPDRSEWPPSERGQMYQRCISSGSTDWCRPLRAGSSNLPTPTMLSWCQAARARRTDERQSGSGGSSRLRRHGSDARDSAEGGECTGSHRLDRSRASGLTRRHATLVELPGFGTVHCVAWFLHRGDRIRADPPTGILRSARRSGQPSAS